MKKKWAFTAAAGVLGGLFLAGVLEVGSSTGWFGLEELASPGVPSWEHSYETTWDPSQDGVEGLSIRWAVGPVSVMPGEGPLITVTEYASRPLEEGERLALSSSGGVLEVGWNGSLLPLGALQDLEKRVEVKVPPELLSQLEELSCWNISGEVSVSGAFAPRAFPGLPCRGSVPDRRFRGESRGLHCVWGHPVEPGTSTGAFCKEHLRRGAGCGHECAGVPFEDGYRAACISGRRQQVFWRERHRFPAGPADRLPHRGRAGLCAGGYFPHPAGEQWLPGKAFQCFRPLYLGFFRFGAGRRLPL